MSLREIGVAAGQRNTGAARYHFGSKESLVEAILEHRMVAINARRQTMLAELAEPDLQGLTEAFVYPLSDQLGEVDHPSWYLRFVLQAVLVRGSAATLEGDQPWTSGVKELRRQFVAALAGRGLPTGARQERWNLFAGFITHALADREQMLQIAPDQILTRRLQFLTHVVDAAVALAGAPARPAKPDHRPNPAPHLRRPA